LRDIFLLIYVNIYIPIHKHHGQLKSNFICFYFQIFHEQINHVMSAKFSCLHLNLVMKVFFLQPLIIRVNVVIIDYKINKYFFMNLKFQLILNHNCLFLYCYFFINFKILLSYHLNYLNKYFLLYLKIIRLISFKKFN